MGAAQHMFDPVDWQKDKDLLSIWGRPNTDGGVEMQACRGLVELRAR